MPSWIQDPITGKLVPKHEYIAPDNRTAFIQGDIESFVSPIDGTVIDDRRKLREHNRRHSVTDSRDYSPEYYARKKSERDAQLTGNTREQRQERIEALSHAIDTHERRGNY